MRSFVVDTNARGRSRGREPVDRYPSQDLVVRPLVAIGPVVEFLVDPGQERDRAVGQCETDRLGLGALKEVVAVAFILKPCGSVPSCFLPCAVRSNGVLEGEERLLG